MFINKLVIGSIVLILGSVVANAEFNKNNGVVTDSITGLQWQDYYSDNDRDDYGYIKRMTWDEAISYCESLTLNGQDDWRMPNINELSSITDLAYYDPAINPKFTLTSTNGGWYWSSTTAIYESTRAWSVTPTHGAEYAEYKTGSGFFRCVRSGE